MMPMSESSLSIGVENSPVSIEASGRNGHIYSASDHRRFRFPTSLLVLALALANFGVAVEGRAEGHEFSGYITSTALNVRSGPGTQSAIVGILIKFDPVTVKSARNVGATNWYLIEASGGYTKGWVSAQFVERGDPPSAVADGAVDYGSKSTPQFMQGPFQYVGATTCQECHEDAVGEYSMGAFGVWEKHFHSAAFQTLKRDYTREIASRVRGIDDPTQDWRCVKCHVTALGAEPSQLGADYSQDEGVGCEVCHGPGGTYADEDHGPDVENREAMGFRVLRDLDERREVCTSCHNTASPTYKPFDLRQFSRKIAHWVDDDDDAYRAEAGRESVRRAERMAASEAAVVATGEVEDSSAEVSDEVASAAAAASAAAVVAAALAESEAMAEAEEASRAAHARAESEAASRAAQARAEAEAMQRAEVAQIEADAAAAEKAALESEAKELEDSAALAREEAPPPAPVPLPVEPMDELAENPLAEYLDDVDDVITMNEDGVKYLSVEFPHLKHALNGYVPDGECQTCHHMQEDEDSPEACSECHDIDGDAEEEKAKKRFVHTKKKGFPKTSDQEEVSCVGCHKSMNAMLKAGEREGDKAPTKCTLCHEKQ